MKIWASTQNDKSDFLRKYIDALKMWECDDVNELIVDLEDGLPTIPTEGSLDLDQCIILYNISILNFYLLEQSKYNEFFHI